MTTYSSVFGSGTLRPSIVSYSFATLGPSLELFWPKETNAAAGLLVPQIFDVNAVVAGRTLTLPPASEVSVGQNIVFNSVGTQSFNVLDNTGGALLTVAPGTVWTLYLNDNIDAAGSWRSYQNGASVSQAQAALLAGNGIKAIGSTLNQSVPVLSTAVTPTNLEITSRANLIRWTGGVGTFTFSPAATLGNDWFVEVRNSGSGLLTLNPNGAELINGAATLDMSPGDSFTVVCDGAAFYTVGSGGGSGVAGFDFTSIAVPGTGDYTLSGGELNRIAYRFTGVLTGNRNIIVPATTQQYWIDNQTTGAFTLTVKTAAGAGVVVAQGQRAILYCDGTDVVDADTAGVSTPISIANGGTGATTAAGARANLGATALGDALFTAVTAAAARASLGASATGDALFIAASAAVARAALAAAGLADANIFTGVNIIRSSDAGAGEIVALDLDRASATPAANDLLMALRWLMRDAGAGTDVAAKLLAKILDATAGSEDAELEFHTVVAGALAIRAVLGQGLRLGSPTGGDKGIGSLNLTAFYENNVRLGFGAMAEQTLTFATPIAWDMGAGYDFTVTMTAAAQLSNPTNAKVGQKGRLRVVQDATGSRVMTFGTDYEFTSSTIIVLSTAPNAQDLIYYDVIAAGRIFLSLGGSSIG